MVTLSNLLAGVVFIPKLEGDGKPPCHQRSLSANVIKENEYAVFYKAISDLAHCSENAEFNRYPVRIKAIICGKDNLNWGNYSTVKDFFKTPLRDLHQHKDLKKECKSMFRHLDYHSNEVVFMRCKNRSCCTEWPSSDLHDHLAIFDFRLPAPVFGTFCNSHFDTFFQRLEEKGNGQKYSNEDRITTVANRLEKCSMYCSYKFKSKTEQKRHVGLFHSRAKSAYKEPDFECLMCKKQFTSLASLNRLKTEEGHNARKTTALVGSSEPPKKRRGQTEQRTINEMLRQHQSQVDLEDDIYSDEETPCSAANCRTNSFNNVEINWVSCESCDRWYHSVSSNLADKSESKLSEMNYVCNKSN